METIFDMETVALDDEDSALLIIDQTQLPGRREILRLKDQKSIWNAIYLLQVRGAPAIGVSAAFGIYLAAKEITETDFEAFYAKFEAARDYLDSARPTAVNLSWALRRMDGVVRANKEKPVEEIKKLLLKEAHEIKAEDIRVCRAIGENGLALLKPGMGLLTHCNAGQLATSKYGTATAPMYLGQERGYDFHVFCDETRPLLQGARLTAFELTEAGIDTTLICDNMAPSVMKQGWVDAVFVGCDRVAANGDTANKIGTSYVALAAKQFQIPFYVCAPTSTIDMNCKTGGEIHIELRPAEEVTEMWYEKRMAPEGVKVYNPSFDVTDAEFITAIITEHGVAYPPYDVSLKEIFDKKKGGTEK
ncbi:S-methyl-5-thioribose-1-phosphate isomerase [Christensenella tenuis]|jgi:methylthioribose-1-phosphate isomerase|uniref:Methylthioribose-1-phosphate isomerase n=1 Tax=Christensenella tenuis TaxID=2763033 RepID=A0ABR7EC57_9FIRM|nr:S-methyl-5-thioribose-1-phosphate isomerase [Christensenella tenuis]MBC5647357.1 S-methyl-5-thioribose-1-phosphate isomerase [Christensenella tenuis]